MIDLRRVLRRYELTGLLKAGPERRSCHLRPLRFVVLIFRTLEAQVKLTFGAVETVVLRANNTGTVVTSAQLRSVRRLHIFHIVALIAQDLPRSIPSCLLRLFRFFLRRR